MQIAEWENVALKNLKLTLHDITEDMLRCKEQAAFYGLMCQKQPLFRQFQLQVVKTSLFLNILCIFFFFFFFPLIFRLMYVSIFYIFLEPLGGDVF